MKDFLKWWKNDPAAIVFNRYVYGHELMWKANWRNTGFRVVTIAIRQRVWGNFFPHRFPTEYYVIDNEENVKKWVTNLNGGHYALLSDHDR